MRAILSLLVALALLAVAAGPTVTAEPTLNYRSQLRADVPPTRYDSVIDFPILFSIQKSSDVYLKVSPVPGNPAFGNGVAGKSGWWTGVKVEGPDGVLFTGTTVGDPPLDFGDLGADTVYTLTLSVHAPAGALAKEGNLALDYILAQHGTTTSSGSGGTLDESTGLHVGIQVLPGALEPADTGIFGLPLWAWIVAGVAVLAVGGLLAARAVGRGKRDETGGAGPEK
jgi:hypothetical protein